MIEFECTSVLDYGCGQGTLLQALQCFPRPERLLQEYDPAIDGKDEPPQERADLVVCTDVLEHIESAKINSVLEHVSALTGRVLFVVISLVPTAKKLSDGRQAHILLRSVELWKYQLQSRGFLLSRTVKHREPKKQGKEFAAVLVRR
jgi:2-polyprenyl-3-methyl-5-hydroxy-6-metoxy-1,4-benzoquinol methylase